MTDRPISGYALLSDCHGAALVDRHGSLDWLTLPRFDSPALFARLLDDEGGRWQLGPADGACGERRYVGGSMVLETHFRNPEGELAVTDALALGPNESGHELGQSSPHVLLRQATCTSGSAELAFEFSPRPEYGLVAPILRAEDGGLLARGGASVLRLSSPVPLAIDASTARARLRLERGDCVRFALQHRSSAEPAAAHWTSDAIRDHLEDTVRAWGSWSDIHQSYQGPWQELVHHSGRILQALSYVPTGAIIAAPTTSLPERIGGALNWDYRFAWVRDASMTLDALWVAACPDEAYKFFDFITEAALTQMQRGRDMQIMFGVGGEHDLSERELGHLAGWRDSVPVRVGNAAWSQRQLDVYGELLSAAERLERQLVERIDPMTRDFLGQLADVAAERWRQPDHGIWEIRGEPQHYLYSKLMCWVALDRAIRLADLIQGHNRLEHWRAVREEIREAILARGWNQRVGAYTQAFDNDKLDAANLVMPLVGFLPANDARMLATVDAIEERLTDRHGLVHRFGGVRREGAFLLCTFWLAHARALAGQVDQARSSFERAAAYINDVGLLSEEVDPDSGELLGNFPQAFSHIGLINAAWAIHQAAEVTN